MKIFNIIFAIFFFKSSWVLWETLQYHLTVVSNIYLFTVVTESHYRVSKTLRTLAKFHTQLFHRDCSCTTLPFNPFAIHTLPFHWTLTCCWVFCVLISDSFNLYCQHKYMRITSCNGEQTFVHESSAITTINYLNQNSWRFMHKFCPPSGSIHYLLVWVSCTV